MPLLDHFHPPVAESHPWTSVHSAWANSIASQLNEILPSSYYALPLVKLGGTIEIDVATVERDVAVATGNGMLPWSAPNPVATVPVDFTQLDIFEVRVLSKESQPRLMAAIELVSEANKDRPGNRRALTVTCANYLHTRASVLVVDVVTERHANLHADLADVLNLGEGATWESPTDLYAVAYRTLTLGDGHQLHVQFWPEALAIGLAMPTLPLWIGSEFSVPVDLEATYLDACRRIRLRVAGNGSRR